MCAKRRYASDPTPPNEVRVYRSNVPCQGSPMSVRLTINDRRSELDLNSKMPCFWRAGGSCRLAAAFGARLEPSAAGKLDGRPNWSVLRSPVRDFSVYGRFWQAPGQVTCPNGISSSRVYWLRVPCRGSLMSVRLATSDRTSESRPGSGPPPAEHAGLFLKRGESHSDHD